MRRSARAAPARTALRECTWNSSITSGRCREIKRALCPDDLNNSDTLPSKKEIRVSEIGPMFPQWALEILRPTVGVFSRVLWKIEFVGVENVPVEGGVIIAANHQTYLDPFWLSLKIKRPIRYLAWSAAFRWP